PAPRSEGVKAELTGSEDFIRGVARGCAFRGDQQDCGRRDDHSGSATRQYEAARREEVLALAEGHFHVSPGESGDGDGDEEDECLGGVIDWDGAGAGSAGLEVAQVVEDLYGPVPEVQRVRDQAEEDEWRKAEEATGQRSPILASRDDQGGSKAGWQRCESGEGGVGGIENCGQHDGEQADDGCEFARDAAARGWDIALRENGANHQFPGAQADVEEGGVGIARCKEPRAGEADGGERADEGSDPRMFAKTSEGEQA